MRVAPLLIAIPLLAQQPRQRDIKIEKVGEPTAPTGFRFRAVMR
jgi:hypothetical protein